MQDKNTEVVTDCWQAYEAWTRSVAEFTQLVQLRDTEVWLNDAVSVGSPTNPRVSGPFEVARHGGIRAALERVEAVRQQLLGSLTVSVEAATREVGVLQEMKGDPKAIDALKGRIEAQRLLLERLGRVYRDAGDQPHPQALVAWLEMLREHLVAGDPRIWVEVKTIRLV
jgi:hypothetical protein